MSHFSLLVVSKEQPTDQFLEQQLTPFKEGEWGDGGKWDWYQIGGRWTGLLVPTYEPEKDPDNIKTCCICHGTGRRMDQLGRDQRKEDPNYTCNGCSGTGKRVKWPTEWKTFDGDRLQVKQLNGVVGVTPFAVLQDGEWHERGKLGWWGTATDEIDQSKWDKEFTKLLSSLDPETWLIVVDCHI